MISVRQLYKYFGSKRALGPVSFDILDGETVGLLGLNGAGKTTALRILACDLRPSAGSISVGGVDAVKNPHGVRKQVGFLPELPPLYGDMTVNDYLLFSGQIRGMSTTDVRRRLPEVEAETDLAEVENELIRNLSHGFRQRVGVAQAIIHKPRLLILDEPTRGLDPVQVIQMRAMIRDLKKRHTVLISSHILPEIGETCDRLLILGDGAILGAGTEAQLSADLLAWNVVVWTRPAKGDSDLPALLRAVPGVADVREHDPTDRARVFELTATEDVRAAVCRVLVLGGHEVIRLDRAEHKLESLFLELVRGAGNARN